MESLINCIKKLTIIFILASCLIISSDIAGEISCSSLVVENSIIEERQNNKNTYYEIGMLYQYSKDYNSAIKFYKKAIVAALETLGDEHPDLVEYYNSIGIAYFSINNYDKAIEYFTKSSCLNLSLKRKGKYNVLFCTF